FPIETASAAGAAWKAPFREEAMAPDAGRTVRERSGRSHRSPDRRRFRPAFTMAAWRRRLSSSSARISAASSAPRTTPARSRGIPASLPPSPPRADALARFASLVAHEVRNPLSAVKIALQTLERHGTLATNDLRRTSIALREVLNIELLLNEVLEFARPPSVTLIPGDPSTPVRDAVEGVEAEWQTRGVVFRCTVPERMPPVAIDPVRVRTAVKILCRQAAV